MTPEQTKQKKRVIYALIVLGFAGLIAAHEFSGTDENADLTLPFIWRRPARCVSSVPASWRAV